MRSRRHIEPGFRHIPRFTMTCRHERLEDACEQVLGINAHSQASVHSIFLPTEWEETEMGELP